MEMSDELEAFTEIVGDVDLDDTTKQINAAGRDLGPKELALVETKVLARAWQLADLKTAWEHVQDHQCPSSYVTLKTFMDWFCDQGDRALRHLEQNGPPAAGEKFTLPEDD